MRKIYPVEKKRMARKRRVRARILNEKKDVPRLSVAKTNKHIYLQIIDDSKGYTLVSANDGEIKKVKDKKRIDVAKELGVLIAKKASDKKIEGIVFDRGRFAYHGIVKSIAEGAREGGLKF